MDKRSNICVEDAEAFGSFETKNPEYKIFDFGENVPSHIPTEFTFQLVPKI